MSDICIANSLNDRVCELPVWTVDPLTVTPGRRYKLRSHEHCEANYLGRLEIIHFENIVRTRSSRRRISGVDSRGSTPGGGFGDTPYLNSLRIVVGTQSVLANPLHILEPCAVGYPR